MARTFKERWNIWLDRLLMKVSARYRLADERLNSWQVMKESRDRALFSKKMFDDLAADAADTKQKLAIAIEAQEKSAQQLIVERELRRTAEERADQYHREAMDAIKAQADWLARGLYHRRPVYGVGAPMDEAEKSGPVEPIHPKPSARQVAREVSNETLQEMQMMLKNLRAGNGTGVAPDIAFSGTVGPEFSS